MIGSLVGQISQTWQQGKARVDNMTKARVSLDLLERDLRSALLARGLPGFKDAAGAPAMTFFSAQPGPVGLEAGAPQGSTRPLSLVGYRVQDNPAAPYDRGLQRATRGYSYEERAPFQPSGAEFPATVIAPDDRYYQVIGPGVLRMDYRFLSSSGTVTRKFVWDAAVLENCSSTVTIYLLVADESTLRKMDAVPGGYALFLSRFDAAVAGVSDSGFPHGVWRAALDSDAAFPEFPAALRHNIHVYERTLSIPLH